MVDFLVSIFASVLANDISNFLKERLVAPLVVSVFLLLLLFSFYKDPLSVPFIIIATFTGVLFFLILFPMGFKRKIWKGDFFHNTNGVDRVYCIYNFDTSSNKKEFMIDFFLLSSLTKSIDCFVTKGELVCCDDGAFFAYQIDDQYGKNFFESNYGVFIGDIQKGYCHMNTTVSYFAMKNNKKKKFKIKKED